MPPTGPDDGGWEDEEAMMLGRENDEGEEELELSLIGQYLQTYVRRRQVPTVQRTFTLMSK